MGGEKSDAKAATLLVPAELESTFYQVMDELPDEHRLQVIATSYLTDPAAWYLLAAPGQHPVIARTRLENSDFSATSLSGLGPAAFADASGKRFEFPG
ncbi:MAG: hypothetical protein U5S82_14765 [Gammaproteobacteria bacterium]|nr:hypothetical protein [Gammaproteobacteria bacterium]